ncbi:MAG: iron ABC transporter permease, partial [Candidatus Latescibacteria bacterium]|nr:iron ABC transporter permease [Candidatus Latescibacterota bacterium]
MLNRHDLGWPTLAFLAGLGIFFILFLFYPLWYAFVSALVVDGKLDLVFFKLMVTNPVHREAILNSFRLGVFATLATTLLSLPIAFLLVRYSFRGKGILT